MLMELETPPPPFMEKSILNFHFDYLTIFLREAIKNWYFLGIFPKYLEMLQLFANQL